MSGKTFVDTNVLIYAHDIDAAAKHQIAKAVLRELWSERTGVLSIQVLQEFCASALSRSYPRLLVGSNPPYSLSDLYLYSLAL